MAFIILEIVVPIFRSSQALLPESILEGFTQKRKEIKKNHHFRGANLNVIPNIIEGHLKQKVLFLQPLNLDKTMVLLVLPMVAPLHLYQGRNKDWKFGERVWEVISKTSGLERAGQSVHRAVRTGGARGAIRSKTFYSKKALDYYLPPQIFQIFLWPWYLKTFSKLNLGYNQLDQLVQTNEESFQLPYLVIILVYVLTSDRLCLEYMENKF